jgi:hypothetical protein
LIEARDNEPDQIDGGSEIDTGVIDHGLDATTSIETLAP